MANMALPVSLADVVDEMEMLGEGDLRAFLDRQTAELYSGTDEQIAKAEENDDDLLDWEVEVIDRLRDILESPDWLELPQRNSHEDYRIMERFCRERCEGLLQEELLSAITNRGAFGRFQDAIHRRGVQEAWYAFRRQRIEEEAREWLEAHGIAFAP